MVPELLVPLLLMTVNIIKLIYNIVKEQNARLLRNATDATPYAMRMTPMQKIAIDIHL
jgi:hypothetical protein